MIIKQTRIRRLGSRIDHIKDGEEFYISISDLSNYSEQLIRIGFTIDLEVGERILPKSIGPISEFNANGKFKKLKDEPMETVYRQVLWKWEDWAGHEHSKIVDVPYQRYPREYIEPPSEELTIIDANGSKALVSKVLIRGKEPENVKHLINLFLEIFGTCTILNSDLEGFIVPKIKRLNWQILPPGEYPWEDVEELVKESIQKAPEGNREVITDRVRTITNHTPNYIAIGNGGFEGYVVYGFPKRNTYILESTNYGNATYVFDDKWKEYSQLSKKEILNSDLQTQRIIHREGWHHNIDKLFK
jgi:hypothetical protein